MKPAALGRIQGGVFAAQMKDLRIFRIVFAILFFAAIGLQFFDIYHDLPDFYYAYAPTALQFVPSLLKFFAGAGIASAWAFLAFMGIALILGRAYCSFVCPFGILMDILRNNYMIHLLYQF